MPIPFVPFPTSAEFALQFTQHTGEFAENTFGVDIGATPTSTNMTPIANAIMNWWKDGAGGANYRSAMCVGTELLGCYARSLVAEGAPSVVVVPPFSETAGTDTHTPLPTGVSFSMTARTGLAGRSFRGRTYLIAMTSNVLASGSEDQMYGPNADAFVTAFNGLITAIGAVTGTPKLAVLSRRHNNAWRTTGVATPVIAYGYHDLWLDYQRRRAPGHNRHH